MSSHASHRILVREPIPSLIWLFVFLVGLGVLIGILLVPTDAILGYTVAGISALALVSQLVWIGKKKRDRLWITVTEDGFLIHDRQGTHEFDDSQIVALDLSTHENYTGGVLKSVSRTFTVTVAGSDQPIVMRNTIPVDAPDPLAPFINRTVHDYRERAVEAMEHGVRLEGTGWSLGRDNFEIRRGADIESLRFDELAAFDIFDGRICVWKRGDEEPTVKIPLDSKNAFLLQLILPERIPESTDRQEHVTGDSLGRILFERRSTLVTQILLWVGAAVCGLLAVIFILAGEPDNFIIAAVAAPFAIVLAVAAVQTRKSVFRCHELGVTKRGLFGERRLLYRDVQQFTYAGTRQYYNGVYTGTTMALTFAPAADSGLKTITFSRTIKNADSSLDALRDHVAQVIGAQMAQRLAEDGFVEWTKNLAFRSEGILYRPSGWLKKKEPILLPYEQVANFDIQEGRFYLWEQETDKSVTSELVSATNFFPGFFLLVSLFSSDEEDNNSDEAPVEGTIADE